jgi:hypothetical protein
VNENNDRGFLSWEAAVIIRVLRGVVVDVACPIIRRESEGKVFRGGYIGRRKLRIFYWGRQSLDLRVPVVVQHKLYQSFTSIRRLAEHDHLAATITTQILNVRE